MIFLSILLSNSTCKSNENPFPQPLLFDPDKFLILFLALHRCLFLINATLIINNKIVRDGSGIIEHESC